MVGGGGGGGGGGWGGGDGYLESDIYRKISYHIQSLYLSVRTFDYSF